MADPFSTDAPTLGRSPTSAPRWTPSWLRWQRSQGYGPTDEQLDGPYAGYAHFNKGWDYGMSVGTPIDSIGGTIVKISDNQNDPNGWGRQVWVRDAAGNIHQYGHLGSVGNFSVGDTITDGTVIGKSGNSGSSTGAHLSYDIQSPEGKYIDPSTIWTDVANFDNGSGATAKMNANLMQLSNIAYNEYIAKGKEPPASLMRQIDMLTNGVSGAFDNSMSPEELYLANIQAAVGMMNAGVGAGQLKQNEAIAKLREYNDQFERGLVSPNGFKGGDTGAPGGLFRGALGASVPGMDWTTKKQDAPDISSITGDVDLGALFGLIDQIGAKTSGGGEEDDWSQYLDKYKEGEPAPERKGSLFDNIRAFMDQVSGMANDMTGGGTTPTGGGSGLLPGTQMMNGAYRAAAPYGAMATLPMQVATGTELLGALPFLLNKKNRDPNKYWNDLQSLWGAGKSTIGRLF